MKKKKLVKKKKGFAKAVRWATAHFQPWSRYSILYCDIAGAPGHDTAERVRVRVRSRAAIRPRHGQDTACDTASLRKGRAVALARAWSGQG